LDSFTQKKDFNQCWDIQMANGKKEDYFRVKDTIKTLKEEIVERQKSRKEPSQSMNYDKDEPYRGR
jgi:hypothetical protein